MIKALAFDVFGTVVDWHGSIVRQVDSLDLDVDANDFALAWRAGYRPAMAKVLSGSIGWTLIDDLHRQILDELLIKFGVTGLSEADKVELNLAWHRLDPWPDTVKAIDELRKDFIVCSLSNGNIRLLVDMAKYAGIHWDYIFSAENFMAYKPSPKTYLGVADALNIRPDELMMVAAHHDDLAAAGSCGLKTAYIERPLEFGASVVKDVSPRPENTFHAKDILDLYAQLGSV
jgi:2-haloacid dehalogenase